MDLIRVTGNISGQKVFPQIELNKILRFFFYLYFFLCELPAVVPACNVSGWASYLMDCYMLLHRQWKENNVCKFWFYFGQNSEITGSNEEISTFRSVARLCICAPCGYTGVFFIFSSFWVSLSKCLLERDLTQDFLQLKWCAEWSAKLAGLGAVTFSTSEVWG